MDRELKPLRDWKTDSSPRFYLFESDFLTGTEQSNESYRRFLAEVVDLICSSPSDHPYNGQNAASLSSFIGSDILPAGGSVLGDVANLLRITKTNSVSLTHPFTVAHLHCPPLLPALAAEVVISALNQSMDSFDQAPFATVVEQKLIRWLCDEIDLPSTSDGTFTTGGSQSNYMGLLLARDAFLQSHFNCSVQKTGLPPEARRLRILCSDMAHFTVEKSASQLGLGSDSVFRVETDAQFRMRPEALEASLQSLRAQGLLPFAVVATAGTTDFGSIDPLEEVSSIARAAGAWFHADAAYGGALLFSAAHRHKLKGIESADSLSIDFHKLLWQPIPCSVFLLGDKRHFNTMALYADYLNPESHEAQGVPNLVKNSLLTTRRFDALKLWISFRTLGREKLSAMIDRTIQLAAHVGETVRATPKLELLHEPTLTTVVFRYLPARVGIDVNQLNLKLRQNLFDQGIAVIGHTRVRGVQCMKFTCMNPAVADHQLDSLIRLIADNGEQLERDWRSS
jgi:L-2,4-diaminobutyrate decarboxylase